ncbi:MAG: helix-turn-helix transcriptional regulator [Bacilli bacterium]|nr:helix-turn-helix transcriptional regulator [Bacilli bacterium]
MSLNEIGNFLTSFRNEIGESLRTMAAKLDISATYLSAIENNKRNIPADFLDKFMEVYNVDEDTKKKLEKAILLSSSNLKVDVTNASVAKKELLYSIANSEIDETTLERLSAILKEPDKKIKL